MNVDAALNAPPLIAKVIPAPVGEVMVMEPFDNPVVASVTVPFTETDTPEQGSLFAGGGLSPPLPQEPLKK